MIQGMFRLEELAPTFTILTNDGGEGVVVNRLAVLKGAKFRPEKIDQ